MPGCADGGHVWYRVFGSGEAAVLEVGGFGTLFSIEASDDLPAVRRFEDELGRFCRLIRCGDGVLATFATPSLGSNRPGAFSRQPPNSALTFGPQSTQRKSRNATATSSASVSPSRLGCSAMLEAGTSWSLRQSLKP
jgi:hypothetical protein